jgi:hypothetical protein
MKEIPLSQGQMARVDDADYELVQSYRWHATWNAGGQTFYALTFINGRHVSMHRLILGALVGQEVDHADHNGLHNERNNIRLCTGSQNKGNRRKAVRSKSSRFKGVSWHKDHHKWEARIRDGGAQRFLGHFADEVKAAIVYDQAARKYFGDFALTNFPEVQS